MRQLKYLKLFEAFESVKLTKILGYINSESRENFIFTLEKLARRYDFPLSQFSDDMFEYLPFKRALNVKFKTEDKLCKMSSKTSFGQYGIEGEVCKSGKVARMWGERIRIVDCPACDGSGIEKKQSVVKIIKFWFSSEGKFITQTGVDGLIRSSKNYSFVDYETISTLLPDNANDMRALESLPNLTKVSITVKSKTGQFLGTIFKSGRKVFCIQDSLQGGTPNISGWQKYGKFSWNLDCGDFIKINVLREVMKDEDYVNPYEWNVCLGSSLMNTTSLSVESAIKDAHFALVLDLNKLKSGEYQRRSEIKDERKELKSGSRLVVNDDDIRKQNIDRYINQIALKSDIVSDISNIKSLVNRGIGGRLAMFVLISNSRHQLYFFRIIEDYYDLMSENLDAYGIGETESKKEAIELIINKINVKIKELYKKSSEITTNINKNLETIKKTIESEEDKNKHLPIVESLERISQKFQTNLMSGEFETIEDLEISRQKMLSLLDFFGRGSYGLVNLSSFIEYLATSDGARRAHSKLINYWGVSDNYSKIIRGLAIVENLVTKI